MKQVNIHEAKTHLSRFIEDVEAGKDVIIAKAGKPVARLTAVRRTVRRRLGLLDGKFTIPDDFNAPLPKDVVERFTRRR